MWLKKQKILEKIAPHLDEGLFLIDRKGNVKILSTAAEEFLHSPKGVKKISFYDQKVTPLIQKVHQMMNTGSYQEEFSYLEMTVLIQIIEMGKRGLKLVVLKDVSNHAKMIHMGREFVGNASHELRTPITIIKGFTELLLEGEGIDQELQKEILEKMAASCLRMEHLVKHLLRLTDLENCDFEGIGKVDIHRLIEDVSYQVISIYPEFTIEHLRTEEEAIGWVDGNLIELVFTNLFKNSVKYSREEKVIIVKVDTSGEQIYIQIHDKGIGIPEGDLSKIFDRFFTVDKAHCRKLGGAGLGLSIVKLIVEKHGGKIYATSKFGQSTTMHMFLPKAVIKQGALL
jgi:two-component system phosphate regulon sensor histidine kinase PhoR